MTRKFLSATVLGFAMPWRMKIHLGGERFISLFDPLAILALPYLVVKHRKNLARMDRILLFAALGFALAVILGANSDGTAALITLYALTTGSLLALIEPDKVISGLRLGAAASIAVGIPLYVLHPELVSEAGYFSALFGAKNGFAFIAGLLAIDAALRTSKTAERASAPSSSRNHAPPHAESLRRRILAAGEPLVWFTVLLLTGSRGAIVAVCIAVLPFLLRPSHLAVKAGATAIALLGLLFIGRSAFPADRIVFASNILEYRNRIPFFGVGAGSGFGLDLYFKSLLEFGWFGASCLAVLLARGAALHRFSPLIVFIAVFGAAHDPTRWPLFWMLVAAGSALRGTRYPH